MKLIFVYNADSGVLNTVKDISHKLFSPATYDCFLCSLTHKTFSENPEWKKFREQSKLEMDFLHRDEFEQKYGETREYPIVLEQKKSLETVISKEQLGSLSSLNELISMVRDLENKG